MCLFSCVIILWSVVFRLFFLLLASRATSLMLQKASAHLFLVPPSPSSPLPKSSQHFHYGGTTCLITPMLDEIVKCNEKTEQVISYELMCSFVITDGRIWCSHCNIYHHLLLKLFLSRFMAFRNTCWNVSFSFCIFLNLLCQLLLALACKQSNCSTTLCCC